MIAEHSLVTGPVLLAEIFGDNVPSLDWLEQMGDDRTIDYYLIDGVRRYSVSEAYRSISHNLKVPAKAGFGRSAKRVGRPPKFAPSDLFRLIPCNGIRFKTLVDAARGEGIPESTAKRILRNGLASGDLRKVGAFYQPRIMGAEV